jgi:hypothetical protein
MRRTPGLTPEDAIWPALIDVGGSRREVGKSGRLAYEAVNRAKTTWRVDLGPRRPIEAEIRCNATSPALVGSNPQPSR